MKHPILLLLLFFSCFANAQIDNDVFVKKVEKSTVNFFVETDFRISSYQGFNPMHIDDVVNYPRHNSFSFNGGAEWSLPYNSGMVPFLSVGFSAHDYSTNIDENWRVYEIAENAFCISLEGGMKYHFLRTKAVHPFIQVNLDLGKYLSSTKYYRIFEKFYAPFEGTEVYSEAFPAWNYGITFLAGLEFPLLGNIRGYTDFGYRYLKLNERYRELGSIKSMIFKLGVKF